MPAGKLEDPHSAEKKRQELKVKQVLKEMTLPYANAPKGDPLHFPPEFDFLMKELNKKGGFKFETFPEIQQLCKLVFDSDLSKEVKDSTYNILSHMINYSNMWIIHYNRHKKLKT